jgi:hypothetical protein
VALPAALLGALLARVVTLEAYTGKFDEGIRLSQLLLMTAGFRPVRDIFAAQGPLSLDIFFPWYLLFGESLAAARLAVVAYSLLGLLAAYWVAKLVGGRAAGWITLGLLLVSPLYLKNSRLALLEVPAMVPATVAVGASLGYQRTSQRRWLVLAALTFALALLIKPMVVAAAAPIGLALLLRPARRWLDLLLFGLLTALVGGLVVLLYGPEQLWQQMVTYRTGAREASDWSLRGNWSILRAELVDEGWPLYVLAGAAGLYLSLQRPRQGLPLISWPLVSIALLLIYSPLQFKHAAILLPPVAIVVGAGLALALPAALEAFRTIRQRSAGPAGGARFGRPGLGLALVVCLALIWYLSGLPQVLRRDWLIASAATESPVESYAEETRLLAALSSPWQFVVVDEPIAAFDARRMIAPSLVDPSSYRIRSGSLSGPRAVAAVEEFDVSVLLLFSDGLRELQRFDQHVDQRYRAVRIYERQNGKDRAIYLRDDADFDQARTIVARSADQPLRSDFGADLRLLGYNLSRRDLRPGSSAALTLHWEAIGPMSVDYRVLTFLRPLGGGAAVQSERSLGGGGEGTSAWEPGRWVVRTQALTVPARLAAGEYQLSVGLYDSKTRTSPLIVSGDGVGGPEVLLGTVQIR